MPKYQVWIECEGNTDIISASNAEDATNIVEKQIRKAWEGQPELEKSAYFVFFSVKNQDNEDDKNSKTIVMNQSEPNCVSNERHNWKSPQRILGGDNENPGVHSHGGEVVITEICSICGCERVTDTWAKNPDTGEDGFETIEYSPDKYEYEIWDSEKVKYEAVTGDNIRTDHTLFCEDVMNSKELAEVLSVFGDDYVYTLAKSDYLWYILEIEENTDKYCIAY